MTGKRKLVNVHVTPYLLGWQVKVNGKRVGRFMTQADADLIGSMLARLMAPASIKLHGRTGKIKSERTYSRSDDPPETPG